MADAGTAPRVTVLMAVFNGEPYLGEAMRSVLSQSYRDFEFLIIDDGSTDRTREIIDEFGDPRVRVLRNEQNIGLTRSLNRGLGQAHGEFVARQDADDVSSPDRLAEQVTFLDVHPTTALVGSWYRDIDARGNVIAERQLPCESIEVRWALRFANLFVHSSTIWRREAVTQAVGVYNESFVYAQDYDYWLRIADRFAVAIMPESLVGYRTHSASMTETYDCTSREFDAISVGRMMQALGWDPSSVRESQARFSVMSALMRGLPGDRDADALIRGVADIRALYAWFGRHFELTTEQRAQLTRNMGGRLRHNLRYHATRLLHCGQTAAAMRTRLCAVLPLW